MLDYSIIWISDNTVTHLGHVSQTQRSFQKMI